MQSTFFGNPEKLTKLIGILLEGAGMTVKIFAFTLVLSIPLGMLVSVGRMSKKWYVRGPVSLYIYVMRGTPLMLQILFIYFALLKLLGIDRFPAVIIAFTVNYAAYFAEIFRGGILAVPNGQREAAQVLGYKKGQTFFRIIFPQVVKNVILPVTNEVITLVKDTALASTVAVAELMTLAKKQVTGSSSIEPYVVAIIFYLILNGIAEQACKYVERKLSYY